MFALFRMVGQPGLMLAGDAGMLRPPEAGEPIGPAPLPCAPADCVPPPAPDDDAVSLASSGSGISNLTEELDNLKAPLRTNQEPDFCQRFRPTGRPTSIAPHPSSSGCPYKSHQLDSRSRVGSAPELHDPIHPCIYHIHRPMGGGGSWVGRVLEPVGEDLSKKSLPQFHRRTSLFEYGLGFAPV